MKHLTKLIYLACILGISACADSSTPEAQENTSKPEAITQQGSAEVTAPAVKTLPFAPTQQEQELQPVKGFRNAWTGDLDTMEENRVIRMLTVYSPGRYYLEENGEEKGLVKEMARRFEDFINKRLKRKTVRVNVAIIPMARSQLIPALLRDEHHRQAVPQSGEQRIIAAVKNHGLTIR